jgi:hypothetical protein
MPTSCLLANNLKAQVRNLIKVADLDTVRSKPLGEPQLSAIGSGNQTFPRDQ